MTASDQTAAADPSQVIDLTTVVDEGRMNAYRYFVLLLIFVAMFADGYDTVSISYAAPIITASWHLGRGAMGSVLGAGQVGLIIGGVVMGPLGDSIGRRGAILISTLLLGVFSLGSTLATDLNSLLLWRFLTGLGIGAIAPLCIVMASEYTPRRSRATLTVLNFVALGVLSTAVCGWITVSMVPLFGWKSLFYVGGVIPLIVMVVLFAFLPESPKFLYVKRPSSPQLIKLLRRLNPAIVVTERARLVWSGELQAADAVPFRLIFTEGRLPPTLLLWLALFVAQLLALGFTLWLPSLLHGFGFSAAGIALTILATAVAGCLGGIVVTRLVDRYGVASLAALPLFGVITVLAVGLTHGSERGVLFAVIGAGFFIQGILQGIMAVAPGLYPTAVRAAGVGLALFLSRFGAILGPVLLGLLLAQNASLQSVFQSFAVPLLITAVATFFLGRLLQRRLT